MKKKTSVLVLGVAVLILNSGLAFAMHHNSGGGHSSHGSSNDTAPQQQVAAAQTGHGNAHGGGHDTQQSGGAHDRMEMLGTQTRDGVRATAQISDISAALAAAGKPQTHHVMVSLVAEDNSATIDSGRVAVRIVTPSGQTLAPVPLQGMDGEFGGDIELREKGTYTLEVGARAHDSKARQFQFSYRIP